MINTPNNLTVDQLYSQTPIQQMTTEMDNNLHTLSPSDSMIVTNPTQEDYELQQLIDIVLEDLYTDSLIEYESSIIFQLIKENCLEIMYSPELPKTCIFSFHQNIHKTSFVLRNPTSQIIHLEEKAVVVIIPRVYPTQVQTHLQCAKPSTAINPMGCIPEFERSKSNSTNNIPLVEL